MSNLDLIEWVKRLRIEASEEAERRLGWAITGGSADERAQRERAAYYSGRANALREMVGHLTRYNHEAAE